MDHGFRREFMLLARRIFIALLFGLIAPLVLGRNYVNGTALGGGGPAPGGVGGGSVAGGAAAVVGVDAPTIAGHTFDFTDFFPRATTVHQGDVVTFHWNESNGNTFHTVR